MRTSHVRLERFFVVIVVITILLMLFDGGIVRLDDLPVSFSSNSIFFRSICWRGRFIVVAIGSTMDYTCEKRTNRGFWLTT